MKWVTYRSDHGERTGVLSGDAIYAMPPDVSLLDLVGRGADGLRTAGERAVRSPAAVVALDEVTLAAPIPRPPSIRDSLCFLDHMRNCQEAMGGGRVLMDTWYRIPAFYFACRQRFWDRTTTHPPHPEVRGRTSNWRSRRLSEPAAKT